MAVHPLLARLGIELPIIQGPMSGGGSTPELAAAVTNAGGLGSLGAAYLTPDQIVGAVRKARALTSGPIGVNLFAGAWQTVQAVDPEPMLEVMARAHAALGMPAPTIPTLPPDPFPAQLDAVLEARPEVFSFTFGVPDADSLARLRHKGIAIVGTATTMREGRILAEVGVDAIVAQGGEAGGHRGTFAGAFEVSMVPTFRLVEQLRDGPPVIAAGGLMNGADIKTALDRGAAAAALGTAFLVTPEAGVPEAHKRALLAVGQDNTVVTRAFSGRPARGLYNGFIASLDGRAGRILPYPLQNALTRAMRTEAGKKGMADYLSLWAGKGVARCRAMPAGDLVRLLAEEMRAAR
jgi:nitronate monooxygenase